MANVIFKFGTRAQYDALTTKDTNTLYWLTDTQELMKGDARYGMGTSAAALAGLTPVDNSIVIADSDGGMTIGVRVSAVDGNALTVKNDGLYVPIASASSSAEFALERQGTATDGYLATYKLKRTEGDSVTYVGDEINIPKDMVLQSGTLETATEADKPYTGAAVGDPYIDLVLNDTASSHIYIPVKGIVDISNKVDQVITNADGSRAVVWNEASGGGSKFYHSDGSEAFVGVNNGGLSGMMAQIYADKQVDGNWVGSRINVYQKGIFYHNAEDKASADYVADDPAHEIATKGDLASVTASIAWQEM